MLAAGRMNVRNGPELEIRVPIEPCDSL